MKHLINVVCFYIIVLYCCFSRADEETSCPTCVSVQGKCHNATHVFDLLGNFRNQIVIPKLGMHYHKNTLYYSFEPTIEDKEYYKVGYMHLKDLNQHGVIGSENDKVYNFGTFAVDEDKDVIYLGGSGGVYEGNTSSHGIRMYSSIGDRVLTIYFKGSIYFTSSSNPNIQKKEGDVFNTILETDYDNVKDFVIDNNDNVFYYSSKGLFVKKYLDAVQLHSYPFIRGIAIDRKGEVYVWWIDGIYKVIKRKNVKEYSLEKVCDLIIDAMTFDVNNNILVAFGQRLYRLFPVNLLKCKSFVAFN